MTDKTAKPGELLSRFPEINFSNYGQQDVEALQAWALEAFDALSATLSPAHVEDEQADFEAWVRKRCGMPGHVSVNWDAPFTLDTWSAWQARAALSAPPATGMLRPYGKSILDALAQTPFGKAVLVIPHDPADGKGYSVRVVDAPPASEQQRAVVMPDVALTLLSRAQSEIESLAESVENLGEDLEEDDVSEEVFEARELAGEIGEFLRLNPHLAKGEGV